VIWHGTVAGIEGRAQIKFIEMSRYISARTDPTIGSDRTTTSSSHNSDFADSHSPPRDGPRLFEAHEASLHPFVRVNTVALDSSADRVELKEDLIVRFGHLDANNLGMHLTTVPCRMKQWHEVLNKNSAMQIKHNDCRHSKNKKT
jgi:hypothetical protein